MSYDAGEALLLTEIRATTNFNTTNAKIANWQMLNSGKSKWYCVLRTGAVPEHKPLSLGGGLGGTIKYETEWETIAELWIRLKDYNKATGELTARRQEIMDRFDLWRRAKDTTGQVRDVSVVSAGDPFEAQPARGAVFIRQDLKIRWIEEVNVTQSE